MVPTKSIIQKVKVSPMQLELKAYPLTLQKSVKSIWYSRVLEEHGDNRWFVLVISLKKRYFHRCVTCHF